MGWKTDTTPAADVATVVPSISNGGITNGPSASAASGYWQQADQQIMQDAAMVPIESQNFPLYASSRVKEADAPTAVFAPTTGDPDITNVWLSHG